MQPLISIIVPIYNVEKYLKECIDSVLSQDFDDYEIIAVNDGSTDNSYNILLEYKENSKVKIFSKPNGGLSDARNFGIKQAEGKYLMFLDSDDYISANCLKQLARDLQKDYDLVLSAYQEVYLDKVVQCDDDVFKIIDTIQNNKEKLDYYIDNSTHLWPVCKSVVKKQFVQENELQFLYGRLHEDVFWGAELFDSVDYNKVYFTKVKWYNYRQSNQSSIMKNIKFKNVKDVFEGTAQIFDKIEKTNIKNVLVKTNYTMFNVYYKVSKEEQQWMANFIKKIKSFLKVRY